MYNILHILLYFNNFAKNRTTMQTGTRKIQTAFRLDEELVGRLKLLARREKKSLNRIVEEQLERLAPAEPQWPKIIFPVEIRPEIKALMLPHTPTKEEMEHDERLNFILNRGL